MDFDYELVIPKNGSFGKKRMDGSWDGVIGDLARGVNLQIFSPFQIYIVRDN